MKNQENFADKLKKTVLIIFVLIPLMSTGVSVYHAYHLFHIGNNQVVSFLVSFTYELCNLAALGMIALFADKVNKNTLWSVFIVLTIIQIIGNVYYCYEYIDTKLHGDPGYLTVVRSLLGGITDNSAKFIISIFIGAPVPILSGVTVHLSSNYLKKYMVDIEDTKKAKENAVATAMITEEANIKSIEDILGIINAQKENFHVGIKIPDSVG
jgi:hypothetical protein